MAKANLALILERLNSAPQYHPMSAETFADWSTEAGDIVTVSRNGEDYATPIHSMKMKWAGTPSTVIESEGDKELDPVAKMSAKKYSRGGSSLRNGYYQHLYAIDQYTQMVSGLELTGSMAKLYVDDRYSQMSSGLMLTSSTAILAVNNAYTQMTAGLALTSSTALLAVSNAYTQMSAGLSLTSSSAKLYVDNKYSQMSAGLELTSSAALLAVSNAYTQMSSGLALSTSSAKLYVDNKYSQMSAGLSLTSSSAKLYVDNAYKQMKSGLELTSSMALLAVSNAYTQMSSGLSLSTSTAKLYVDNKYTQMSSGLALSTSSAKLYVDNKYTQMSAGLELSTSSAKLYAGSAANAASIVARINASSGQSELVLEADHIQLDGNVKINGAFSIDSNGYMQVKKTAIFQGNVQLTTANSTVTAPNFTLNSGGKIQFIGGNTGEYYNLTATALKSMVKSFSVSGNVLTLTPWYGDAVTFSKAVTLDAAWGSGTDLGKYVVKAYENSEVMATHKYDPPMRLMGGSPPTASFSAEITSTSGSTTVAQKQIYGYLKLKGSTTSSYVEVNTNSAGTGSTVAQLSVGSLYTDGKNAVTLYDAEWNSVTSVTAVRTVTVKTKDRPTQLSKSKTVYLTTASAWDGGMMGIYIRDGSTSGTAVATSSVSIPNVTSVTLGSISSGATCNCGVTIGGTTKQSTVDCSGKLYAKTGTNKVTANGTYTPPSGYIGFSSVEVSVSGGGGAVTLQWDTYPVGDGKSNTIRAMQNGQEVASATIFLNVSNMQDNVSVSKVQAGGVGGTTLCQDDVHGSHNLTVSENVHNIGTSRGSRTNAGTLTSSSFSPGSYLGFSIKCGGTEKQFYVTLN